MRENAAPGGCAARADVGIGPYSKDESQSVRRKRSGSAATRTRNARPYGGIASWCAHRKRSVGADVGIGPYSKDESQSVRRKRSGSAATRTRNARPYGGIASWCAHRKRSVGADAYIGPNPPQAGLFPAGALAADI